MKEILHCFYFAYNCFLLGNYKFDLYLGLKMAYINKVGGSNALIKMGLCYGTEVPAGYSAKANWQVR